MAIRSKRLQALPPYLFIEIDRKKRAAIEAGKDVIALGIGDPDHPTPAFIREAMVKALDNPANHRYPLEEGVPAFRQAAAAFLQHRFGVLMNATTEITAVIGSKEALGHLPLAVVDPGDVVLVPQPAYTVYRAAASFAAGVPYDMPLTEANGWLPDLDAIPSDVAAKAKLMVINYPNNPTAAIAPIEWFEKVVAFAKKHNIIVCQDAAYTEVYFDTHPASILQVDGAKDVAIEIHSCSKTFNMTGWRIGFAVGNADVVSALATIKTNLDSGQFNAIQVAAAEALSRADHIEIKAQMDIYRERRDVLCDGMAKLGFGVTKPQATFYVWAKCPAGLDSMTVASRLLDEAAVVMTPGVGFGEGGKHYIRAALTADVPRIREALDRMAKIKW